MQTKTYSSTMIHDFYEISSRVNDSMSRRAHAARIRREQDARARDTRIAVVGVIFVMIIVLGTVVMHNVQENARFDYAYDLPRIEVIVHQGDTIDGIASAHPVSGLSAHELGYVIADINEGAYSIPLMPGDRIMVPVDSMQE